MKIAIAGGTGLIGRQVCSHFQNRGDEIFILTRNVPKGEHHNIHYVEWLKAGNKPENHLENTDVMINLAGKSINCLWTKKAKKDIVESRIKAVEEIIRIIQAMDRKPKLLINASAVGIYGTSETGVFSEDSAKQGNDFLAKTVQIWESQAKKAEMDGVRVVLLRLGVVLDKQGGALPKMVFPYLCFAGGTVGKGTQWISWIHIKDVVGLIQFCIEQDRLSGPVNAVSPHPVKMKQFGQIIGKVLKRPHWLFVPDFLLKTVFGEMSMLLTEGQHVLPKKALTNGYQFAYPKLEEALNDLYH